MRLMGSSPDGRKEKVAVMIGALMSEELGEGLRKGVKRVYGSFNGGRRRRRWEASQAKRPAGLGGGGAKFGDGKSRRDVMVIVAEDEVSLELS